MKSAEFSGGFCFLVRADFAPQLIVKMASRAACADLRAYGEFLSADSFYLLGFRP
jgi:hypothetical protein